MKLDILFWFYKEIDICKNRLQMLKKNNPNSKIYGLYWWPHKDKDLFENELKNYLDDFYEIKEQDSFQKWIHWDIYLVEWYINKWQYLSLESIVIAQWDLVAFQSFDRLFDGIKEDQIYLPHYGLIDKEFEDEWRWTSATKFENTKNNNPTKPHMRQNYLSFKEIIYDKFWYKDLLPFCIFTVAVLPKVFFEKYQFIENKEVWFLEYKIPTYANLFEIELFQKDFGERAQTKEEASSMPINAFPIEIKKKYIQSQLKNPNGWRMFHPYYKTFE